MSRSTDQRSVAIEPADATATSGAAQQQQHNTNQTKLEMPNCFQGLTPVAAPKHLK